MDAQDRKDQEELLKMAAWAIDHECNKHENVHCDLTLAEVALILESVFKCAKRKDEIDDAALWLRRYHAWESENK